MRSSSIVSAICVAVIAVTTCFVDAQGEVGVMPGTKASAAAAGSTVDGLALSLSTRPLNYEAPGHVWLALELRNLSGEDRWFTGLGLLTSLELRVTDQRGHVLPTFKRPTVYLDPGPFSSYGVGIGSGDAAYLPVPVDAFVSLPRHGRVVIVVRTVGIQDAHSGKVVNLVSNPQIINL